MSLSSLTKTVRRYTIPLVLANIVAFTGFTTLRNFAKHEHAHAKQCAGEIHESDEDRLHTCVQYHRVRDMLDIDSPDDDVLENRLKLKIIGDPSLQDLREIETLFSHRNNRNRAFIKNASINSILVLPKEAYEKVDYAGKAYRDDREIRLFSGRIMKQGTGYHELAHFGIWQAKQQYSWFIDTWEKISGRYDKVVLEPKRDVVAVKMYKDGSTTGPKHGYVEKYGGKSLDEDIATFTATCIMDRDVFDEIESNFGVYQNKTDLLYSV